MKKQFFYGFIISTMIVLTCGFTSYAIEPQVSKRTRQEIKNYLSTHSVSVGAGVVYDEEPSYSGKFSYGKVSDKSLNEALDTLNAVRYITGLDEEMLNSLKSNHKVVVTLEDGELNGGFGEKIARFYGKSDMKVLNYGSLKEFTDRTPIDELYTRYRLTPELITEDIEKLL